MTLYQGCLGTIFFLIGIGLPPLCAGPPARLDLLRDPLPPGARVRMGDSRLRHGGKINALAFSPEGVALASASDDQTVCLWEVASGKQRQRLAGHQGNVTAAAFAENGKALVTTDARRVHLWDTESGERRRPPTAAPNAAPPLAASADGRLMALPSAHRIGDCTIRLADAATGRVSHTLQGHQGILRALAFSPNGRILASGSEDETIRLWDTGNGKLLHKLVGHDNGVRLVVFAMDGKTLASVGDDETIRLWEVDSGRPLSVLRAQPGWGQAVAFAADGRLAVGCVGGYLEIWESGGRRRLARWQAHPRMACAVAWSAEGKQLASGGLDGRIRLWEAASGKEVRPGQGHQQAITRLGWSADGKYVVTASRDESLRRWDAATGKELSRQAVLAARGHFLAFSPDGKLVAARRRDGRIAAWSPQTGAWNWQLPPLQELHGIVCLTFAPDGKLAAGHKDGTVRLWDEGREWRRFEGHTGLARRLHVSPDGQVLAIYSDAPKQLHLWSMSTGKLLRALDEPPTLLWSLALAPDGRVVAAGSADFTLQLWETATGKLRGALAGHRLEVRTMVYSPDGRLLISAGGDRSIRVWDTATGREIGCFDSPSPVNDLALAPDGQSLASGGEDGTALVWDLAALPRTPKMAVDKLAEEQLDRLWKDLGQADAVRAYAARCILAEHPAQTLAFLKEHLHQVAPPEEKRLAKLLDDLDSNYFTTRERASQELAELGELAEAALRKALDGQRSAEVRRRAKELLEQLNKAKQPGAAPTPQHLWSIRAVELLERLGTPKAQALLADLAKGAAQARLTQEAQAALQRLRRHAVPSPTGTPSLRQPANERGERKRWYLWIAKEDKANGVRPFGSPPSLLWCSVLLHRPRLRRRRRRTQTRRTRRNRNRNSPCAADSRRAFCCSSRGR